MKPENYQKEIESNKKTTELLSISLNELKEKNKINQQEDLIVTIDESFDDYKKKYKSSLETVIPNVEPIGSEIMTTAQLVNIMDFSGKITRGDFDIDTIENFKSAVNDVQIVVAVGKDAKYVKVGDKIKVRLSDFERVKNPNTVNAKEVYELPLITIKNKDYLTMNERNVHYIIKE